jgi:hypothetical protein
MPSASSRPAAHSWQRLRKTWLHDLTDLKVSEISLVDSPASRGAVIALAKRDTGQETIYQRTLQPGGRHSLYRPVRKQSKPGGVDELALPVYPVHQDPEFPTLIRPRKEPTAMPITSNVITDKKKRKKKFSSMMESISKGDAAAFTEAMASADSGLTHAQQVALVRKRAEQLARPPGGTLDQRTLEKVEADLWKDLYAKGQVAPDDIHQRVARQEALINKWDEASAHPVTKTEAQINALGADIAKAEKVSFEQGRSRAWERNPHLYVRYLTEFNEPAFQQKIAKAARIKDDPGSNMMDGECDPDDEECDDADDTDEGPDKPADKRRKAKARKTTCMCGKVSKASKPFCSACGRRK